MHFIKDLKRYVHQIDAVLLSYPDHHHLGALPYMVGKCEMSCPIYATVPVYKMGQMFMYDLYQSRHNAEEFDIFTLDDVDSAFDKIIQLKYSQTVHLRGKGHGLQITPLPAGHMLGGTIWKIVKEGEEEIVYAVDYNHKKERHLNGCVLETIARPSLLITDAFNALYNQSRRRLRDEQLMTTILQTMRSDGNVLVAVDTAGRMLELVQLLDQMWRNTESGLTTYSLALLNNVSFNVVEFAKSQVEWMSDKIMRAFEDNRNNPFQFKHVKLCHNLAELARVPEPKVVLASTPDLQCGYSRDLFVAWCGNSKNSIVLTAKTSPRTLARWLIDNPEARTVTLEIRRRVRLDGPEFEEYQRKKHEHDSDEARRKAQNLLGDESSSDESDVEVVVDSAFSTASKGKHDLMAKGEGKSKQGFFKAARKAYPMFQYHEDKIKWDEYGEIIRPEDYIIADSLPPEDDKIIKEVEGDKEEEMAQDTSDIPTKCVSSTVTLDINASVQYIDFEGRSDGDAIRRYLSQIKPRQLVLIHGTEEATNSLAEFCYTTGLLQGQVFTPSVGDFIDATTERHIYQVRLRDHLVSSLTFAKARDTELAWVDGTVSMQLDRTDTTPRLLPLTPLLSDGSKKPEDDEELKPVSEVVPTLEPLPPALVPPHTAVFMNEPRLSDFKMTLTKAGIHCEFVAGVLICNNLVAVRRESGRIQVEGTLCEDYYKVRELLYEQYAIV